jgi:DNA-binding MarR family transcriptional regulator
MTFDALNALHARLRRLRDNCLAEFGLTHAQLRVIAVIHHMKCAELSFVARTLDVSRQAVHRIVRRLEASRYLIVERGESWRSRWNRSGTRGGRSLADSDMQFA